MKNTYTNEPSRSAALAGALNRPGIEILRYGLVIVLLWVEVLQLYSHPVIGWLDAPPGTFGLRFIQVAAI